MDGAGAIEALTVAAPTCEDGLTVGSRGQIDDRLGRKGGRAGDAANVVLAAVGHNFRRILAWLREFLCLLLVLLSPAFNYPPKINRAS